MQRIGLTGRVLAMGLIGALFVGAVPAAARGVLVLEGGAFPPEEEVARKFVELAGGEKANIVVIPTALKDEQITEDGQYSLKKYMVPFGIPNYTVLHTRDREIADSEGFVAPLRKATGVWITGGSAATMVPVYLDTRTQRALKAFFDQGGVIGGDSGGANVLGSLLLRGGGGMAPVVASGKDRAFGLLPNTAIDSHVTAFHIENELVPEVAARPGLLGIGIDEATAIIVKGSQFEIIGKNKVLITDGKPHGDKGYYMLSVGDKFDLGTRTATPKSP